MIDRPLEHSGMASYARDLERLLQVSAALLKGTGATEIASQLLRVADQATDMASLIEQIPSGVLVADAEGRALLVNESWRRMWGNNPDPAVPVHVQLLTAFQVRDPRDGRIISPMETPLARALAGETVHNAELLYHAEGEEDSHWTSVSAAPRYDVNGTLVGAVTLCSDLTSQRRLERELATSAEYLRSVYSAAGCGLMIVDSSGAIIDANEAAATVLGVPAESVRGELTTYWRMSTPDGHELSLTQRPGYLALKTGKPQRAVLAQILRTDGAHRWLQIDAVPVAGPDARTQHAVISFIDVTDRKHAEASLEYQALHDALTDLPNRSMMRDRLRQGILTAQRNQQPLALLLIDLDRFKEINDTLGHHHGDLLLRDVAMRLRRAVRAVDTVARLGGDEFAVILPVTDEAGAIRIARSLLVILSESFEIEGQILDVGASIGIALCPDHGTDGQALLRQADVAMYVAKRAHGGYSVYAAKQDQHSPARLAIMSALRHAIASEQLILHYQPKVTLANRQIHGVEALVRWRHPELGLLLPDSFIPVAEGTTLIASLTTWVLETAIRQCHIWQQSGLDLSVAVNLSVRTLQDLRLPETVADMLQRYRVPPERLTLEITESALMADPLKALDILTQLANSGVRVSIDDFGTGYSSLGYLKRLPAHEVKIDKSFVLRLGATTTLTDTAIVRSVVALAEALGLAVVAEGIESQEAWDLLRILGCHVGQGHYLSRPLSAEGLAHWATTSPWRVQPVAV